VQILEIVAGGGDALKMAFAVQREHLKEKADIVSIDITTMGIPERKKVLSSIKSVMQPPDAILLRGIEFLPLLSSTMVKCPIFIDHCTPVELGKTSPLSRYLDQQVKRVYCYSERAESELRQAGIGRVKVIAGPSIPTEHLPSSSNGTPRIAFLKTCSRSQQVMAYALGVARKQEWKMEAISPLKGALVTQVDSNLEAVEAADFVVAPYEDRDFGQPHEGAILAHSVGRPMTTARTLAFSIMGFPVKNFIAAEKHLFGTYAAAVGMYLRNRDRYDDWVDGAGPRPYDLPQDLLSRMS
jgi:hypothetical protein